MKWNESVNKMDVFKLFVLMKTLLGATVFSYSIEYVRTNGVT